jgi:ParE toxin of type II toxin-antitoxin system, parDE
LGSIYNGHPFFKNFRKNSGGSIGSIRSFNNKELAGLRMLRIPKFEKYLIFYRPMPEGTEIIRVLHAARDISSIFGERAAGSSEEQKAA